MSSTQRNSITVVSCVMLITAALVGRTIAGTIPNSPPVANADAANAAFNAYVLINVAANDEDVNGNLDPRSVAVVTNPQNGAVVNHGNGSVTYIPATTFTGADSFTYVIKDLLGATSAAAKVTVKVSANPTADAGPDQNAVIGKPVNLEGSASSAPNNKLLSYAWQFVSVPTGSTLNKGVTLVNPTSPAPSFTPDVAGAYTLRLQVSDGSLMSQDTVVVVAAASNGAPNANAGRDQNADFDSQPIYLDGSRSADPDNGPSPLVYQWAFVETPAASKAVVTGATSAQPSFTPDKAGLYRLVLSVSDGAATSQDEVRVLVQAPNVPPNADAGSDLMSPIGKPVSLDGTKSNDPDANTGTPFSYRWSIVSLPKGSRLSNSAIVGANAATPSLSPDALGMYVLRLSVSDAKNTAFDQVVINANSAPVAVDDSYTVNEDTLFTEAAPGFLVNDTDADLNLLTGVGDAAPQHHKLFSILKSGSFRYRAATNYNGTDSFTYHANDGTANSNVATVNITVTPVNDAPSFTKGADQTVDEDAAAQTVTPWATAISTGPSDESTQTLTFNITNNTNSGLFSVAPVVSPSGVLTYTVAANATGTAAVTLTLSDSGGTSNGGVDTSAAQTFNITVSGINDAPSFTAVNPPTVNEDAGAQTVPGWATFNAGAPSESSQTVLAYTVSNVSNAPLFTVPPAVDASGNLTYTLAANVSGSSTFDVKVQDDGGTANGGVDVSATQTFTLTVNAVNDTPSFTKGADQTVNEDAAPQTVAGWATAMSKGPADESSQTLTFQVSNDNTGLFSVQPNVDASNGNLTYTLAANANGSATVTLSLKDNGGTDNSGVDTSAAQTFTITVNSVNDVPSFTKGADQAVNEDAGPQAVGGWATSISPGPDNESSQAVSLHVSNDNNALFSAQPSVDANGNLTYTSAANANGVANVSVHVTDNGGTDNGGSDTSGVQSFVITVNPVDDPPVALDDAPTHGEDGGTIGLSVMVNDNDIDGGANSIVSVTQPTHGTVINNGGLVSYTPASNYCNSLNGTATDDFTYTLSPGGSSATVRVTVNCVNDAPVATGKTASAHTHMKITGLGGTAALTSGVTDADHGVSGCVAGFTVNSVATGANGTVSNFNGGFGTFDFDPAAGYAGNAATATYKVSDNASTGCPTPASNSADATITITVSGPVIWFVDNTNGNDGNSGVLSSPFKTLSKAASVDNSSHRIFLYSGTYTDGIALTDSESLVGQGASGTDFDNLFGITPPTGTIARPSVNGTRPTVQNTVTLNSNAVVKGLNISTSGVTALADPVGAITGVTVGELNAVASNAPAVNLSDLTTGGMTLGTTSSTGAVSGNNVNLTNITGTVNLGTGTLSGATGTAFNLSGGTTTVSYGGTISQAAASQALLAVTNHATGALTLSGNLSATNGTGLQFSNADGGYQLSGTVTLNGGDAGIDVLSGSGGTINLSSAASAITNPSGIAVAIDSSTPTFTYAGNITKNNNATTAINLTNNGGSITFSGATHSLSTSTATAVNLDNNDNASISFTGGGLGITTTSGAGFNAINGATAINVTGGNNTISSGTGTALKVASSTIGGSGLTFKSISASGGANGIHLDTTGSNGGLTVTGDGSNTSVGGNSTGGTLQGMVGGDGTTAGNAVYLKSTKNVVLRRMTIGGTNQNYGIRGSTVDGFTLEYSTVNGTNGTNYSSAPNNAGEGAIYFGDYAPTNGIATSGTFTNNNISGGFFRNLSIINTAGTTTLTFKGNNFGLNQNVNQANQSLAVEARNSGTIINATVGGTLAGEPNTFTGSPGDLINFTGQTGTTVNVTSFQNNSLSNSHAKNIISGGGVTLATQGVMTFTDSGNTQTGADGSAITLQKATAGTNLSGTINNHTIGSSGVSGSGSKSGNGIFGSFAGTGTIGLTLTNNTVRQYGGNGGFYFDNTGGSYTANFTMTGNTTTQPGASSFTGLAITNGSPSSSDTINVCARIVSNDFSAGDPTNSGDVYLGVSGAASGHTFNLPSYSGGANLTNVQNFVKNNNLNSATTAVFAYNDSPATAAQFTGTGTTCPTP
ncbi:tandem-95 repeat protein [Methylomagnum sp.]